MLCLDMSFDKDFADLYNRLNSSPKGKEALKIMGLTRENLDIVALSKRYFSETDEDRTIDVNANVGSKAKSPNNYLGEITKGITKLNGIYLLWKELRKKYTQEPEKADKIISNLIRGDYYFHDLSGGSVSLPYCFAWASNNVFSTGRPYGQLKSKVPKRSDSFIAVIIESMFDLGQDQMGALAVPDMILNLAYFYYKEGMDPKKKTDRYKIYNDFQRIIHSLNQQYRLSNQSLFTNISIFDRPTILNTFQDYKFPDGSSPEDILEYIMDIQEIYIEFVSKKDPSTGLPYRFPVNTLNIHVDENYKIQDEKFLDLVYTYNSEGIFNIFISRGVKLASCCRLLSDPIKLREYARFDSFANAGLSLGSARVVTINFARIGKLASKHKEEMFFEILEEKMEEVRQLLIAQRRILERKISEGFLKFFDIGWMNINMFFSTFGMNGLFEALQHMGYDIREERGLNLAKRIFEFIENKLEAFSEWDKIPFNFEQVPAEGAASLLARLDKNYFGSDYPYEIYSNQFIPLWENSDVVERAKIDGRLCQYMSGGSICHLNIGGRASKEQMKALINLAISSGLEHFALNPNFNICEKSHVTLGSRTKLCPKCGSQIVDSYTRVVGYFTKVSDWDKTRRGLDFPKRVFNYL